MASAEAPGRPALSRWAQDHLRVFFATLGRLWRNPLGTLLTCAVIGITLALPSALHLLVKNLSALSYSWEGTLQVSLFLKDEVSEARGRALAQGLAGRPGVARADYLSREQALREFRDLSGFGDALDLLDQNPLPAVIVVTAAGRPTAAAMDQYAAELGRLPEVELAKLDQKWLERLYALLALAQRGVAILAALLGLTVIVSVGNTIRLDIENRREEIVVMKLIGATDAFIRRPFLHAGFCYGLLGGLIALILLGLARWAVAGPAHELAGLYGNDFRLQGLSFAAALLVLAGGLALGVLGSLWTVARHLGRIEPYP